MAQLVKHEGYCLWDSTEYEFMNQYYQMWPQGCTKTGNVINGTINVYYDTKPLPGGQMGLGLYLDQYCSKEYTGSLYTAADVFDAQNNLGSSFGFSNFLSTWNADLSIFHICQPCKEYSRSQYASSNTDDSVNGPYFHCEDAAGVINANMCTLFKTNTQMQVASYADLQMASSQSSIQRSFTGSDVTPSYWEEWGVFTIACVVFALGLISFCWAARPPRIVGGPSSTEPLVEN